MDRTKILKLLSDGISDGLSERKAVVTAAHSMAPPPYSAYINVVFKGHKARVHVELLGDHSVG